MFSSNLKQKREVIPLDHYQEPKRNQFLLFDAEADRWRIIPVRRLISVRAEMRHCRFFLDDGTELLQKYHGINKTARQLEKHPDLVRVSRGELINLRYVKGVDQSWDFLYLNRKVGGYCFVSVGKKYRDSFRRALCNKVICLHEGEKSRQQELVTDNEPLVTGSR
ncbi:MAG: hypothetical protein GYB31_08060 [Bacteroidetes bacterium]|nr:hypothetical protein [Bacteroidota bacterium]